MDGFGLPPAGLLLLLAAYRPHTRLFGYIVQQLRKITNIPVKNREAVFNGDVRWIFKFSYVTFPKTSQVKVSDTSIVSSVINRYFLTYLPVPIAVFADVYAAPFEKVQFPL